MTGPRDKPADGMAPSIRSSNKTQLQYSVEQVFLIHRRTGLLLQHRSGEGVKVQDADMVSGMLEAILISVSGHFAVLGQELEGMKIGNVEVWITHAPQIILVGFVRGTPPAELRIIFRRALDCIVALLEASIRNFDGETSEFDAAAPFLESCLIRPLGSL